MNSYSLHVYKIFIRHEKSDLIWYKLIFNQMLTNEIHVYMYDYARI